MTASLDQVPTGSTVSFETFAPQIIGAVIKDAVVLAHLDVETVRMLGGDPYSKHAQIYPLLPTGVVDNAAEYMYLKLQLVSKEFAYIGLPWIREETIVSTKRRSAQVVIEDVGPSDVSEISLALTSNGFSKHSVTLI